MGLNIRFVTIAILFLVSGFTPGTLVSGNSDWVASCGAKGITSMSVDLVPDGSHGEKYYNVTLFFVEPEDLAVGERVFDVYLQGEKVIENFDIVSEAGRYRRVLKREFSGLKVDGALRIDFSNGTMMPVISGVEIVMDEQTAYKGW